MPSLVLGMRQALLLFEAVAVQHFAADRDEVDLYAIRTHRYPTISGI
jgi:hypothetical protein